MKERLKKQLNQKLLAAKIKADNAEKLKKLDAQSKPKKQPVQSLPQSNSQNGENKLSDTINNLKSTFNKASTVDLSLNAGLLVEPVQKSAYEKIMNLLDNKDEADPVEAINQFHEVETNQEYTIQPEHNDDFEPRGFIGKYQQKLEDQTRKIVEAKQRAEAAKMLKNQAAKELHFRTYSKEAPKHKGILARIAEKEEEEASVREQAEKQKLIIEAISDPNF